jgi:AcrR family transcriptional regulator
LSPREEKTAVERPSRPGLRLRGKLEKRARIIRAAKKLFARGGFDATTTLAIAREADIGVGTLFSYVSSKEDLLILVFMDDLTSATERACKRAASAETVLDRVFLLYRGLLAYHYSHVDTSQRLLREVAFVENPLRRLDTERLMKLINGAVAGFIASGLQPGCVVEPSDIPTLAENCFAIYYRALSLSLNRGHSYKAATARLRQQLKLQLLVTGAAR